MPQTRGLNLALTAGLLGLLSPGLVGQGGTLVVRIAGVEVPPWRVRAIVVDSNGTDPDSAEILLRSGLPVPVAGRGIDIAAVDGQIVFHGEATASQSSVVIRALDKSHRLNREKHTRTFIGRSDAEIVQQLALDAGLLAEVAGPEAFTRHDTAHQENETDLAFLQERAARIGFTVFTDAATLHFRKVAAPSIVIGCEPGGVRIDHFLARLASPRSVQRVNVRGWDPVRKQEITGEARQGVIPLSSLAAQLDPPPSTLDLGFVEALPTGAAVHAAVAGTLSALTRHDLSAELSVRGSALLRVGALVVLQGGDDRFNGRYVVSSVSHRYDRDADGGWNTLLRLVRKDRGVYLLPEVGEEVLVAFEHGDVDRPVIVGSLWNTNPPVDSSPCRRRTGPVIMQ